ncbi:excisionase family DNA-binding protein [Amycolatopsis anabasis]|uniref:excisionase family DNA-binding protein n=1 Tax=Amycolatopsis anabasis TaxID=1840409 RepID=UPI00131E0B2E
MTTSGNSKPHRDADALPRRAWKPKEVSIQLGIPYETVLGLIHDGKLGAVPAGRYYLIPDFELERYLQTARPPKEADSPDQAGRANITRLTREPRQ